MAEMGYCPSGRLFEAAACGTPVLTDEWDGLKDFFEPGTEILTASTTDDVVAAMDRSDADLVSIAVAARERTLADHTAERRATELVELLEAGTSAGV
jgi:spore maturation protein CgeB